MPRSSATRRRWCRTTPSTPASSTTSPSASWISRSRVDYRYTGRTWWEPYNTTSRDPIDLVDARVSLGDERWTATLWGKNLTDEEYNQEFSPGGFLFKALPLRYGIEFAYNF